MLRSTRLTIAGLAITSITGLAGVAHAGGVLNVPGDAPTIQVALNLAADGDEIVVAPGTYFESLDLLGKDVVLRSSDGPETTIIDALGQLRTAIECTSGESLATVVQGFTIRNGEALATAPGERGGGLYVNASSVTVRECVFVGNTAVVGGAIYANAGTVHVESCRFIDNLCTNSGGALYINSANLVVTDSAFTENTSELDGGGITVVGGTATFTNARFEGNHCQRNGGAIRTLSGNVTTIDRCVFIDNLASDGASEGRGGAIFKGGSTFRCSDSIFQGNECNRFGGASYVSGSNRPLYDRCTFEGNVAGSANGASDGFATIRNSIVWNCGPDAISAGESIVSYSNVEGGYPGTGNISLPPMFMDVAGGDLRLAAGSPCIDAGDTLSLTGAFPVDFDGNERAINDPAVPDTGASFLNLAVDIGAFERPIDGDGPTCTGDLNGDGNVDGADLATVLGAWGVCP